MTPSCPTCTRVLDRVDHYGIEHLILRDNVYQPVGVDDGDGRGECGVASEVDLRCGYCHTSIPRATREFFYRRWYQIVETLK